MKELSFGEGSAVSKPILMGNYVHENVNQITTQVKEPSITFGDKDRELRLTPKPAYCMHFLNPPLKSKVQFVTAIYNKLYEKAYNYQREHLNSWFSTVPELILVSEGELEATSPLRGVIQGTLSSDEVSYVADLTQTIVTPGVDISDEWLRLNVKKLCSRVAERVAAMDEASTMLLAATVNLFNLGKYEGTNALEKSFAVDFKWTSINSATNRIPLIPFAKGVKDYLIANSDYVGLCDGDGNPVISIPMWAADIFGNRGFQSINPASKLSPDGEHVAPDSSLVNTIDLVIAEQINKYVGQGSKYDMRMPFVENGAMVSVDTYTMAASCRVGMYGDFEPGTLAKKYAKAGGDISIAVWNCYQSWLMYFDTNFRDFCSPASDWYKLITNDELLGGYEYITSVYDELFKPLSPSGNPVIRSGDEYLNMVKFASSGRVSHTTIVKTDLLSTELDDVTNTGGKFDNAYIDNFDRFRVYDPNRTAVLERANFRPSFTPHIVVTPDKDGEESYFVTNAPPSLVKDEAEFSPDLAQNPTEPVKLIKNRCALVYGARSLYDLARTIAVNPETDRVDLAGLTRDEAVKVVSGDEDTKVYREYEYFMSTDVLPIVDDTDPYACGFYLIVGTADVKSLESSYGSILCNPTMYLDPENSLNAQQTFDVAVDQIPAFAAGNLPAIQGAPLAEVFDARTEDNSWPNVSLPDANKVAKAAHLVNEEYRNERGCSLVFVGANITSNPVVGALAPHARAECGVIPKTPPLVGLTYDPISALANAWHYDGSPSPVYTPIADAWKASLTPNYGGIYNSNLAVMLLGINAIRNPFAAANDMFAAISFIFLAPTYGYVGISREDNPFVNVENPASKLKIANGTEPDAMVKRIAIGSPMRFTATDGSMCDGFIRLREDNGIQRALWGISRYALQIFNYTPIGQRVEYGVFESHCVMPVEDIALYMLNKTKVQNMGEQNSAFFDDADKPLSRSLVNIELTEVARTPNLVSVMLPKPQREVRMRGYGVQRASNTKGKIRFGNSADASKTESADHRSSEGRTGERSSDEDKRTSHSMTTDKRSRQPSSTRGNPRFDNKSRTPRGKNGKVDKKGVEEEAYERAVDMSNSEDQTEVRNREKKAGKNASRDLGQSMV